MGYGIRTNTHRTYTPGQIPTGQLPPLQNTPWTYTHQFFLKIKILNKYTLLFLTFHLVVGICPGGILQGGNCPVGICPGVYVRWVFVRWVFVLEPWVIPHSSNHHTAVMLLKKSIWKQVTL